MDIEMFGKISDAFGPSGFEEEVVRTVVGYCGKYQVENDAMNNLYVRCLLYTSPSPRDA